MQIIQKYHLYYTQTLPAPVWCLRNVDFKLFFVNKSDIHVQAPSKIPTLSQAKIKNKKRESITLSLRPFRKIYYSLSEFWSWNLEMTSEFQSWNLGITCKAQQCSYTALIYCKYTIFCGLYQHRATWLQNGWPCHWQLVHYTCNCRPLLTLISTQAEIFAFYFNRRALFLPLPLTILFHL